MNGSSLNRWHLACAALLIICNFVAQTISGDRIPAGDGLGFDGIVYGEMARDLPSVLSSGSLDSERLKRILPSAVIYAGFRLLRIDHPTNANIILGFTILNLICQLGTVILWEAICHESSLRGTGFWFGFIGLFVNTASAKWCWYYPVLTDSTILLFATLLTYTFVRQSLLGMALTVAIGSFASSTLVIWSLPLFLTFQHNNNKPKPLSPRGRRLLQVGIASAFGFGVFVTFFVLNYRFVLGAHVPWFLLPLTTLAAAAYLIAASSPLLRWSPLSLLNAIRHCILNGSLFYWVGAYLAITQVIALLQGGNGTEGGIAKALFVRSNSIFLRAIALPLGFLVAHVGYFGPAIVVLALRWRVVGERMCDAGVGPTLFAGLTICMSLTSESRHLLVPLPFLLAFTAMEIVKSTPSRAFWICYVATAIVGSRAWLTIGADWGVNRHDYPQQLFFMMMGPWMAYSGYFVTLFYAAVTCTLLRCALPKTYTPRGRAVCVHELNG